MALTPDGREIENRHRTRRARRGRHTRLTMTRQGSGGLYPETDAHDRRREQGRAHEPRILHKIGCEPTPEELAEKLGMPLERVRKVLKIAKKLSRSKRRSADEEDLHLGYPSAAGPP
jgi:hypothetical protein